MMHRSQQRYYLPKSGDHDMTLTGRPMQQKLAEIKRVLDQYVIGQERAKKILAVAVHNHYKRIDSQMVTGDVDCRKAISFSLDRRDPEKPC